MGDLFNQGEEASRDKFVAALEVLQATGQDVLDSLDTIRLSSLLSIERRLSCLNGQQRRALRVWGPGVAGQFLASDLLDTNQALTSTTLRADSQSVTLRERQQPGEASILSVSFSASAGTVEKFGPLYRVHVDSGGTPSGTFDMELASPLGLSFLILDLAPMPSDPGILVQVSDNGVTYNSALQTLRSGYRVNVWLAPQTVRFIRLVITPTHPDNLGGSAYTFGMTDFHAFAVEFHLQSEWVSLPVTVTPQSSAWWFRAPSDSRISYFLSFNNGSWSAAVPDSQVAVPDIHTVSVEAVVPVESEDGKLDQTLTNGYYLSTIQVTENGQPVRLAPGLDPIATLGGIATAVFAGTGLDDAVASGTYNGVENEILTIKISTGDTVDKFQWKVDEGEWNEEIEITGTPQALADGVSITFGAITGHTKDDAWTVAGTATTLQLTNTHIVIADQDLYLRPFVAASDPGRRFQLTYIYGPAPILARLRVRLSTSDRTTTPVFTGASLEVA